MTDDTRREAPKSNHLSSETLSPEIMLPHISKIAAAYLSHHQVEPEAIGELLSSIHDGLKSTLGLEASSGEKQPEPAVSIEESLSDDVIICLEDGLPFQSLKRHLRVKYDMTPDDYRKKWGLPADYPMVAPAYAKRRSELAKRTGLGRHRA